MDALYFTTLIVCQLLVARPTVDAVPAPATTGRDDRISNYQTDSQYVQDIMRLAKAAEMHSYMDKEVDPCEDFYEFACGNWAKINPANSMETVTTGLFEKMLKAMNRKESHMLQAGAEPEDTDIDRKVKDFFASCLHVREQSKDDYRDQLIGLVKEFGGMPALKDSGWDEQSFDWVETVGHIAHKYGKDIILGVVIMADFANNTVNRVYISHPELRLETRSMYLDNVTAVYRQVYKTLIKDQLHDYLDLDARLAKQTAHEIVEFEVALAHGIVDSSLGLGMAEMMELSTVEKMQRKYNNSLDIRRLVQLVLGEDLRGPVYDVWEKYQENLIAVMGRTPKSVVANYIGYQLLSELFLKREKAKKMPKICLDETKKYFAKNLDNMIYRRYNNDVTERDVNLIWSELKQSMREALGGGRLSWINARTRQLAIEKLEAMRLDINSYESTNFTEEFGELRIDRADYIGNIKRIDELGTRQAIAELYQKPKPLEAAEVLSYTPANVILENRVRVPVSLLQPFFIWAANYPNALKFGTVGALIGHELIHGFDDNGRKYDKDGNHQDWWDEASQREFEQRTKCFVDQYSEYVYGGRQLPRSESQAENIADNGGLHLAYASYKRWLQQAQSSNSDLHLETLPPPLDYTREQLFFLSYAQVWCNDVHPRLQDLQTSTDSHVPGKFRVIGPLSNFAQFAKAFECKPNSTMVSKKPCEIY